IFLFLIQVLCFILYLIFGRSLTKEKIFKWDTKSRLGVEQAVNAQLAIIEEDRLPYKQEVLKQYKDLYYMLLKHNDAIYSQNNLVDLFTDGKDKFSSLIRDIENATDHIHLLYYIVRHDQLGTRLANVLIKKANEGVEVRLLHDDAGSRRLSRSFIKRLE